MKRLIKIAAGAALCAALSGCLAPRNTSDYWIVMVDVTPSVEFAAENPGENPTDGPPAPGPIIESQLSEARKLDDRNYKMTFYEIAGTLKPVKPLTQLPKSVSQLDTQDQQISDYVRYLDDAIDRYGIGSKNVRLTVFGDFRHVSGSVNYKNWTPSPKAFGSRRMDGWDIELIIPDYPSGSSSGIDKRAEQWKECFEKMGAASVVVSTTPKPR